MRILNNSLRIFISLFLIQTSTVLASNNEVTSSHVKYGLSPIPTNNTGTFTRDFYWSDSLVTSAEIEICKKDTLKTDTIRISCFFRRAKKKNSPSKLQLQSQFTIVDEQVSGLFRRYAELNGNFKIEEGMYSKGKKTGLWRTFHSKGTTNMTTLYISGFKALSGKYHSCKEDSASLKCYQNINPLLDSLNAIKQKTLRVRATFAKKGTFYEGPFSKTLANGMVLQSGFFKQNKPSGLWKWFNQDRSLTTKEGHYRNGMKYGKWIERFSIDFDNKVCKKTYENGLLHGTYSCKNDFGKVETRSYISGKKHGSFWCKNCGENKITLTGQYEYGVPVGAWIDFYPNGKKAFEHNYKSGQLEGIAKSWTSEGTLIWTKKYKKGIALPSK